MSNQDTIASQNVTTTDSNNTAFDVTNVLGDWDGLIYTFCYKDKDNLVNGFYQTYCIESWGKINTCLLYTSPSPRDRQKSRMPSSA